jgi:hypothetical protein
MRVRPQPASRHHRRPTQLPLQAPRLTLPDGTPEEDVSALHRLAVLLRRRPHQTDVRNLAQHRHTVTRTDFASSLTLLDRGR